MTTTIQLLVTLYGETASVRVERFLTATAFEGLAKETIVEGRSFDDVIRAIGAAALESQGRKESQTP